jgi:hypothetical protein
MSAETTKSSVAKTAKPAIYAALIEANKKVGAISKDSENYQQKFKFRGIDDVYNELHPILAECGIVIIPEVVNYEVSEKQGRNGILLYTRATIRHHFTASDGSYVTTTVVGEAMDSGDKGMNKAMSIALKYALFQLFTIPTKEDKDPDATTHELVAIPAPAPVSKQGDLKSELDEAFRVLGAATSVSDLYARFGSLSQSLQLNRVVIDEAARVKALIEANAK